MSKDTEQKAGYVTYLSPTKPCKGGVQYDMTLQDGEETATQVKGFGSDSYRKMKTYHDSKKPVRVQLFKNEGYKSPALNTRCKVEDALYKEVPFDYNSDVNSSSGFSKPSIPKDIATILDENNEDSYYTVNGRVQIGTGPIKTNNGQRLKEDNAIIDSSEKSVPLTLWNNIWEGLDSGDLVSLTHLKLKHFREKTYLTTSPFTVKALLKEEDVKSCPEVSEDLISNDSVQTVKISNLEVGLVTNFSACQLCRKKVDESKIRPKSFACQSCKRNLPIVKLVSTYLVPLLIRVESEEIEVLLSQEIAEKDLKICSEDELMDALFESTDFSIKYSIENNQVLSIVAA